MEESIELIKKYWLIFSVAFLLLMISTCSGVGKNYINTTAEATEIYTDSLINNLGIDIDNKLSNLAIEQEIMILELYKTQLIEFNQLQRSSVRAEDLLEIYTNRIKDLKEKL